MLVTLSDAALARLKMIPRIPSNPYLICGTKRGRPLHALGVVLRRVVRRAGLTNLRVHDLRRMVGSWLAHAGASLHLIGDVLNHLDLKTALGYAHFQTEHRRAALNGHAEKVLSFAHAPLFPDRGAAIGRAWTPVNTLRESRYRRLPNTCRSR